MVHRIHPERVDEQVRRAIVAQRDHEDGQILVIKRWIELGARND